MTKKAIKESVVTGGKKGRSVVGRSPSVDASNREAFSGADQTFSPHVKNLTELITRQLSSSPLAEDEAVGAVINSIVGHLGDSTEEGGELKHFLETLVETDPELKSELISLLKK